MKSTFLALAMSIAALNVFAPAVGHAQDYIVNGHNASKAEAQFLASYSAPAGNWQVDGYGFSRVADEHPAPPVVKTADHKCWYVLEETRLGDALPRVALIMSIMLEDRK